jgi:hypothetical protein
MTDLYLFARQADASLVPGRREIGLDQPVRFVASTTGRFQAFAVVELGDLSEAPTFVEETFGNPTMTMTESAVPLKAGPKMIRWTKHYEYIAFSRIRAEPGMALDVLAGTAVAPGYNGSAIVAGAFDILVEFGSDDYDELQENLLTGLHHVKGVSWSETAIVTDYFYRGPREQSEQA